MRLKRTSLVVLPVLLSLILSACGASASNESVIATSVAMTVQAQDTQKAQSTPIPAKATNTPTDPTATVTKAPPTAPPTGSSGTKFCTASANFVGETYPDGTIVQPGAVFKKVWHVKNSGTCAWDSSWKLVFNSGDLMGGAYVYNFPQPAQPGQTVDVPVVFTAPSQDGSYKGEWMLESPWGTTFGVGQYSVPLSVAIVVGSGTPANNKTATVYGVTSVTYDFDRSCTAANTFWTVYAHITTNGPVDVTYTWVQSDGNNKKNNKISFSKASTKTVQREWSQGTLTSSHTPRWMQIIVTSPNYQEFGHSPALLLCGD